MFSYRNTLERLRYRRRNWHAWYPQRHAEREAFYPGVYGSRP